MSSLTFDKLEETRRLKYAQMAREVAAAGQATEGAVGKFGGKLSFFITVLCERPGSDQEIGNGAV